MKWNGSIYYNVISQDNVGVDRVALELSPCPVFPSHYWQRPWMRRAEGMQARTANAWDGDLPISCRPTHPKPSLPRVTEDDAESQTWFLGPGRREAAFALKRARRFSSLMQTPPAGAASSIHSVARWKSTRFATPFASLFSHFSFLRPHSILPGKIQVEMDRQVPRCRCSREHQQATKIHILTQHKASVSPLMAHLPAAGLSSQAAK